MLGAFATAQVDPRLASYDGNGELHGVRYMEMTALLTAAVQGQQWEIWWLRMGVVGLVGMVPPKGVSRVVVWIACLSRVGSDVIRAVPWGGSFRAPGGPSGGGIPEPPVGAARPEARGTVGGAGGRPQP